MNGRFKRLLDWEAEWLLHERPLSFPVRLDWRNLPALALVGEVSKASSGADFVAPMTLRIGNTTLMTPGRGAVGWLLFHRWRLVATVGESDVNGRLRLNVLDRSMGLFVANAWALMLALMIVLTVGNARQGTLDVLFLLLMVPILYLGLWFVTSMYVPLCKRSEASVRALLGDPIDIGVGPGVE